MGLYEEASRQLLNREKTSIFFSKNTKPYLMEIVEQQDSSDLLKYLGLPSLVGRSQVRAFQGIIDKVKGKMGNWKNKCLSQVGKESLLKLCFNL